MQADSRWWSLNLCCLSFCYSLISILLYVLHQKFPRSQETCYPEVIWNTKNRKELKKWWKHELECTINISYISFSNVAPPLTLRQGWRDLTLKAYECGEDKMHQKIEKMLHNESQKQNWDKFSSFNREICLTYSI